ncbi:hypothetical protein F4818DRAFT_253000 [Hypoxylon cercidicola]|nr:hypothetical protein F4818DRAFT_253000 [Hypoxylon cercidicola]
MELYAGVWRRRHLIPSWFMQIVCALVFVAVGVLLLVAAASVQGGQPWSAFHDAGYNYYGYSGDQPTELTRVSGAHALGLGLGTFLLDTLEIFLFLRRRLNPVLLLCTACLKTLVWGAQFIASVVGAASGSGAVLDIIVGLLVAVASVQQLVLGAVYTHRKRRGTLHARDRPRNDDARDVYETTYGGTGI